MKWFALTLFSLITLQSAQGSEIILMVGPNRIHAQIANTPDSRATGLMKKTHLCENCGMLFVFPKQGNYKFWMKGTPLPLSIAFVTVTGQIINIQEMQAFNTALHSAPELVLYTLEMNKGWYSKHGIIPLEYIKGLQNVPTAQ